MATDSEKTVIDKTSRLLDYLAAVARDLQVKPARDISQFDPLITPADVPNHSRVHLRPTSGNESWLSIPRIDEPERPILPEELEGFVDVASLDDLTSTPVLLHLETEPDDDSGLRELLLDEWVGTTWAKWALKCAPARAARSLYERIYALHLRAQRDQATHELVWGHAILGWSGQVRVLSPMIVTQVSIEIDETDGTVRVLRDSLPELEIESLEGLKLQGMEALAELRMRLNEEPIDPWDEQVLLEVRKQIIAPLGLHASLDESEGLVLSSNGPVVNNGWALYLRLRPARHGRFYTELSQVLKEGEFLPESIAAVVADEVRVAAALRELGQDNDDSWVGVGTRLLMPLASNQDQERIAIQLAESRGVTVQGPPGTGKSHTIVNLVSHLIAHGKRVLVTAQNEQALSVLRDKFPEELRDLTVSVLGSTPAAMDQLRSSVQVITDIAARTDENK